MRYITSELTGHALDRAVAVAMGWKIVTWGSRQVWVQASGEGRFRCNVNDWKPSTNPAQAWPIIEQEKITLYGDRDQEGWAAVIGDDFGQPDYSSDRYGRADGEGDTSLMAAMRCFVASKLGSEFELDA